LVDERICRAGTPAGADAEAWPEKLAKLFDEIDDAEAEIYNSQPEWHLRELSVSSPEEGLKLLNDFLGKVVVTSSEYCWPHRDPGKEIRWRVHGWKHIEFESIESILT
jgi:hypothetical protein